MKMQRTQNSQDNLWRKKKKNKFGEFTISILKFCCKVAITKTIIKTDRTDIFKDMLINGTELSVWK